jgi:small subunit ribosomal protein S20
MAEDKAGKKTEAKAKKPSALKRNLQSEKKRTRNKSYRASVLTSVRALETSINQKESPDAIKTKLNEIYSLMDKGVKRGIYKPQKAARTKSRLTARCAK